MRRSQFGLLIAIAAAGLLLAPGCQVLEPIGSLTVVSINGGNTLRSDLSDFYVYFDRVDSEYIRLFQITPETVPVEMQYAEIGAGLPTWRPGVAVVTSASVKFRSKNISGADIQYEDAKIALRQAVPSDQTGKKITTFSMNPISASWKQKIFGGEGAGVINEDDEYYNDIVDLVEATITFTGYDSVANRDLITSGAFLVEFGNFYDDPSRFGK